jgi:hypothetical protein
MEWLSFCDRIWIWYYVLSWIKWNSHEETEGKQKQIFIRIVDISSEIRTATSRIKAFICGSLVETPEENHRETSSWCTNSAYKWKQASVENLSSHLASSVNFCLFLVVLWVCTMRLKPSPSFLERQEHQQTFSKNTIHLVVEERPVYMFPFKKLLQIR